MGLVAVSTGGTLYGAGSMNLNPPAATSATISTAGNDQLQAQQAQQMQRSQRLQEFAAKAARPHTLAACAALRAVLAENMRATLQKGPPSAAATTAKDLMTALALCNAVVPQLADDGHGVKYQVQCP